MRKFALPLVVFLAGCGATGQYTKSVGLKDVASYQVIQESRVCWKEAKQCFVLAVLRGPDGNDYLKVDHEVGKQRDYRDYGLKLCNLTALRESIEKTGKGRCEAEDRNMGISGHPYIDYIRVMILYGDSLLPFAPPEYTFRIYSYRDAPAPGYVPWKIRLSSHATAHPVREFIYGIEWDRGKVRVMAKKPKDRNLVVPFTFKGELYGNWIDLTPYIPVKPE